MYPTLPFGPLSLPTTPLLALIAFWLALEVTARSGRRFQLDSDDVWNIGLVALLAALLVARLWNVFQFREIYLEQPQLILSLRPSGFVWPPGIAAGLIVAYIFLLRNAMDPVRVLAAFGLGGLAAAAVFGVSHYLTGAVVGTPTQLPWATWYYGAQVHPVGLYRTVGFLVVLVVVWWTIDGQQPWRTIWQTGFGYSMVRLITDGFVGDPALVGQFRASQLVALLGALVCAFLLAQGVGQQPSTSQEQRDDLVPESVDAPTGT